MDRQIRIPSHLDIAVSVRNRLAEGWSTNEAFIAGIADLESFVRTNPSDAILITEEPLDTLPISKHVIGRFETLAQETNGKVPFGFAAIQRIGILATAVRALEVKTQELERRLAKLENNTAD